MATATSDQRSGGSRHWNDPVVSIVPFPIQRGASVTDPAPTDGAGNPPVERDPTAPDVPAPASTAPATPVTAAAAVPVAPSGPPAPPVDPALERRAFVRRMGSDAVRTAGSVFSLSRILTRSAAAAGQAVMTELESLQVGNAADEAVAPPPVAAGAIPANEEPAPPAEALTPPADASTAPAPASANVATAEAPAALSTTAESPAAPTAQAVFAKPLAPPAPPSLQIDPDQRVILEGATTAVVAVNREGHPPQLTTATVLWDGETIRFATLGWARRTTMLRADPRIGLLVEGPGDGRFVTVTGQAHIADGREARDATWPLLLREIGHGGEAAAEARWQALVAADLDRAVIIVTPEQVLSGRR